MTRSGSPLSSKILSNVDMQRAFHDNNINLYHIYRNRVNRERKRCRSKYFALKVKPLKETKPSLRWREVKRISGMVSASGPEDLVSQLHIDILENLSPADVANRTNEAFLEPMLNYQPLDANVVNDGQDNFKNYSLLPITEIDVFNCLSKLNPRKASGPDGLPNWLLKEYALVLAQPVSSVLNSSFLEKKLPSTWKHAYIIPIPKQKPITIINKHLRPISLTPTISKVAENFVVSRYIAPAVLKIIDPNQSGAIPKSSTTQALSSMVHQWAQATDCSGASVAKNSV